MEGFVDAQYRQYFEPFLNLQSKGEVFVDVGSFDGYTSKEFIKKCPFYDAIHIVEPDPTNMEQAKSKLIQYEKIKYHKFGASDTTKTLYFKSSGSSSSICDDGDLCINVTRLDELIDTPVSFIKMDIEGAEIPALKGASKLITKYKPRLAISTYHRVDDLWKIPKLVFSYYNGYKLYIRHYTEGVTETVLFFIPHK